MEEQNAWDKLYHQIGDIYELQKSFFIEVAAHKKKELLKISVSSFNRKSEEDVVQIARLWEELIFFPDKEILKHLKQLGFKKKSFRWMISLNDLDQQFRRIQESGFVIIKPAVLDIIFYYLHIQTLNEIQLDTGFFVMHDGRVWNTVTKEFYEMYRRAEYARNNGKVISDDLSITMFNEIEKLNGAIGRETNRKYITDFTQGKIEDKILPALLDCVSDLSSETNEKSQTRVLNVCYNLFQLICKNHNLPDKNEIIGTTRSKILRKLLFKE